MYKIRNLTTIWKDQGNKFLGYVFDDHEDNLRVVVKFEFRGGKELSGPFVKEYSFPAYYLWESGWEDVEQKKADILRREEEERDSEADRVMEEEEKKTYLALHKKYGGEFGHKK